MHCALLLVTRTYRVTASQDADSEIRRLQEERKKKDAALVGLGTESIGFDHDIYGGKEEYAMSIPTSMDEEEEEAESSVRAKLPSYTAPDQLRRDVLQEGGGDDGDVFDTRSRRIADREDEYHARRRKRVISPERVDAFSAAASVRVEKREGQK